MIARGELRVIHKDMYERAKRTLCILSFQHNTVTLSYMHTKVATIADLPESQNKADMNIEKGKKNSMCIVFPSYYCH